MNTYWEARLGSLIAAGGVIWAVHKGTLHYEGLAKLHVPADPLLVCCIGIVLWLHAKWRGTVHIK
ncbi:MAG TPA: hypothetical protein VF135_07380 [Terriglobales bacterium]